MRRDTVATATQLLECWMPDDDDDDLISALKSKIAMAIKIPRENNNEDMCV